MGTKQTTMGAKTETDTMGIPLKANHPALDMGIPIPVFYMIFNTVITSICLSVTYFVVYPNTAMADSKIATLASLGLGWTYLGLWVIKFTQLVSGINLGLARTESKVGLPNQHVYKVQGAEGSKLGYVLMETEGAHGKFNRAQRAVQNYNEGFPLFGLMFLAASFVFPFAAFLTLVCQCIGKVFSALGYTASVDGRMPGTMGSILCSGTIEAMVLFAGLKAIM